jgi:putative ABC transport system permease protein
MWRLAVATLRFRRTGLTATFLAMALGTAIVLACGGLMETGVRVAVPPQRLAAAAVVVTGDQAYRLPKADPADPEEDTESATLVERVRVDAGLVNTIQTVPGVARAVGTVSFPAVVLADGRPVAAGPGPQGHDWALAALTPSWLRTGTPPARPGEVVLDATLAQRSNAKVGDRIGVAAGGTTGTYLVTGVATPAGDRATDPPALFFSAADTRRLAGHPGRVDAIGVLAAPGTDVGELRRRVQAAIAAHAAVALVGDDRGLAEFPEARGDGETLIAVAAVFGGIAVMVALLVVASTLALSVQQRRREMALLRAVGATPRQVRRMILGETLVVAALATAVGCAPGGVLGRWLFDQLAVNGLVPSAMAFRQGWIPAVAAVGVTLLTALAAALVAGRRAALTRPGEVLAEADADDRWLGVGRLLLALLFLAGGVALAIVTITVMTGPVAASTAGPTVMVFHRVGAARPGRHHRADRRAAAPAAGGVRPGRRAGDAQRARPDPADGRRGHADHAGDRDRHGPAVRADDPGRRGRTRLRPDPPRRRRAHLHPRRPASRSHRPRPAPARRRGRLRARDQHRVRRGPARPDAGRGRLAATGPQRRRCGADHRGHGYRGHAGRVARQHGRAARRARASARSRCR